MKRNIEIDDTLEETVEQVKVEVKERFDEIVEENPDFDSENIYQEICDSLGEICDVNTPIHTREIDGLYYLYSDMLEDAYNDAGCYDKQPNNYRQVCIYFYLEQQAHEYLQELRDEFEEARE